LLLSIAALQNLDDGTGVAIPTASYAVAGWFDLAASAELPYLLWGSGGEFKPRPQDLLLTRDLGALGKRSVNLASLVPGATITFWARASF
jgi:hypothetical protein